MRELAVSRGGQCLSKRYINAWTKLRWRCADGHEWESAPANIKSGSWCHKCGRIVTSEKLRLSVKHLHAAAKQHGGKCLSKEYKYANTRYLWRCAENHEWLATLTNVKTGTWCPHCAGRCQDIEDMRRLAKERGGDCISKEFRGMRSKLRWRCALGHEWEAVPFALKVGGWCPSCKKGVSERIVRAYLEQMCNAPFPSDRPSWLTNAEGTRLELDGYCPSLNVAFEHQGRQHYQQKTHFNKARDKSAFDRSQRHDARKKRLCKKKGIHLIEVPQIGIEVPVKDLYRFLEAELAKAGLRPKVSESKIKLDDESVYTPEFYKKFKKVVSQRGGEYLSGAVISVKSKVRLRCEKGHEWEALPDNVIHGSWCPDCSRVRLLTLEKMQALAKERGGVCLSKKYKGVKLHLRWRCSEGHEWRATPDSVIQEHWCPKCARVRIGRPGSKYSTEDLHAWAKKKGGRCLAKKYEGVHYKYRWKCAKGHVWENSWANIHNKGQWCRTCWKGQ